MSLIYWRRLRQNIEPVIVAGGRGLRLGAFTEHMPKPMLLVEGKPLLEHQLAWLKAQGFGHALMALGYKAEAVQAHFGDGARFGIRLSYHVEKEPRGTAGCVKDLAPALRGDALIVYGDLFPEFELAPFIAFHEKDPKAAATLVVWDSDHPYDSDLARLEGDRLTGFYRAKPGEPVGPALAALWIVRKPLLELAPADRPSDFGRDVFPEAVRRGLTLRAYKSQERLADLGTPERVEAFLASRRAAKGRA